MTWNERATATNQDDTVVQEMLCRAIRTRSVVTLIYPSDGTGAARVCHPHVVYESATGKIMCDVYQVAGYSSSAANLPAWRQLELPLIGSVETHEDTFEPTLGYNPANRKRYRRVICGV